MYFVRFVINELVAIKSEECLQNFLQHQKVQQIHQTLTISIVDKTKLDIRSKKYKETRSISQQRAMIYDKQKDKTSKAGSNLATQTLTKRIIKKRQYKPLK